MKDFFILKGGGVELTGAPETITVLPLGHVVSSKGEFDVDEGSFQAMKAQIAQRGVDLVVDYEHQTLKGVEAPAAGWVKELKLEDGNIVAVVEWTPRGAEYLKNKEYRYLSPVVNVRKTDNKAIGLHSLALTNTPAIENMTPIVNSDNFEGGHENMDMQKLAAALGLGPDATEEQLMEALQAMIAENKSLKEGKQPGDETTVANKAVCELLDLRAGAPAEDVTAKIMELKSGTIDGVNVLEELKALKQQNAQRDADEAVTLALKAGKITPAQKDWARSYALADPRGFGAFVEKAPQVVPMGEIDLGDGERTIRVARGVFVYANTSTAANKVGAGHVLKPCYIQDDQTVTALATGASVAGLVIRVDDSGVAVEIGTGLTAPAASA